MTKKTTTKSRASKSPISFPCEVFRQGKHTLVLFLAKAKDLYKIVSANELVPDKDEGYQRVVSPSRRKKIANFIDAGNPMPLSILISFDKGELVNGNKTLQIPNTPSAGWIIDGQHRLAGAHDAKSDIVLPVVAFLKLDVTEQINQFVTINREQVGVPTSLYYELLARLPQQLTEKQLIEERATDLAKQLRRDAQSPFYNKIVLKPNPNAGQISTTNFVRKISPYLKRDNGFLFIFTDEERRKVLDNLYNALRVLHPKEFRKPDTVFFRTIGFGALINILPTLYQMTVHLVGGFTTDDIVKVLSKLTEWDPAAWRNIGTGGAAENRAGEDLLTLIYQLRDSNVVTAHGTRL